MSHRSRGNYYLDPNIAKIAGMHLLGVVLAGEMMNIFTRQFIG